MKQRRVHKLNIRILTLSCAGIFILAMVNTFVFARILRTLETEVNELSAEQVNTSAARLNAVLNQVKNDYLSLMRSDTFDFFKESTPGTYKLTEIENDAKITFLRNSYISEWAIFFEGSDSVVSSYGVHPRSVLFSNLLIGKQNEAFWKSELTDRFSRRYYCISDYISNRKAALSQQELQTISRLFPIAYKNYWKNELMTVIFLDADSIIEEVMGETQGVYLFSSEGKLLYTSDEKPLLDTFPDSGRQESLLVRSRMYTASICSGEIVYVQIVPEVEAAWIIRNNLIVYITAMVFALIAAICLIVFSLRRTMTPINDMLHMLQQHSSFDSGNLLEAKEVLTQALRQREEQAIALAEREKELSEFILHSQMLNVYVDQRSAPVFSEGVSYIIYIRVHYRIPTESYAALSHSELENCLQEILLGELKKRFDAAIIFQIEPGCFVARVSASAANDGIESKMASFLSRLECEDEFAYFTVLLSQHFGEGSNLAEIYGNVLEACKKALVKDSSQMLFLPVPDDLGREIKITLSQEQKLTSLSKGKRLAEAASLAESIIKENTSDGISFNRLDSLCIALVNAVAYAVDGVSPGGLKKETLPNNVYHTIISHCFSECDYIDAVAGFITSLGVMEIDDEKEDPIIACTHQFILENYRREFTIEEMADTLNISRSYLSSYYKEKTDSNLSDRIQKVRIDKAKELIDTSDMKIADIAAEVGFSNVNTFVRQFKKFTGMTPTEYKSIQ